MMKRLSLLFLLLSFISASIFAQDTPSIRKKTKGLEKQEGFFTYYRDQSKGKVWLKIDKLNAKFLYLNSLTGGVGSNDIGLDRNQLGDDRVVYFERRGPKVLMIQPNYSYRAITDNKKERQSVHDAFAQSVLWGFEVVAESGGAVLVDATDFLLRDAQGVAQRLKQGKEGNFSIDKSRSALYPKGMMNFPKNTELEATLTFTGTDPGQQLRSVTPSAHAVTVRQHHSFVELPDDNFNSRRFDPRAGFLGMSYQDYSTPINKPLKKRFIVRHRLKKKYPNKKVSEPVEPIVYYLDPGTPEPVRSALLKGARWWSQAFKAAGYKNAFKVKMLPDSANAMDVRYNVINWVHRSTRGWSYGTSVIDPRTGEIIKGHVLLGSLRVRQDFLIAEGLLSPYKKGENYEKENPMLQMALARVRQLSAHEVGHTLGLAHNFSASTNGRESVMDYPAPKVRITKDSTLDLSDAYDTGIGEWDKTAITYGYKNVSNSSNENQALNNVINNALDKGLRFISDADARPDGGANSNAHLWDNGKDPVQQLHHVMDVRKIALQHFSESNIPQGTPMAKLEDALVPIYLFHRFQVKGTAKLVGGLNYSYNLRGDSQHGPKPVSDKRQRAALNAVIQTLSPDALKMPQRITELIPPRPLDYYNSRELFKSHTDPAFDPLGAAETAASMPAKMLLNANRAARLVQRETQDSKNLGFSDMLQKLIKKTWKQPGSKGYTGAVQNTINHVVLVKMMHLAANKEASSQVRAIANFELEKLRAWMKKTAENEKSSEARKASLLYGYRMLNQFKKNDKMFAPSHILPAPPGSPIGSNKNMYLQCSFDQF